MSDALLIAAHGSRDEAGVEEFWTLADAWRHLRPDRLQAAGFLEFARPTIGEAIDTLVDRGATRIVVVPAMLMAAGHVKNDVPSEVQEGRSRHPGVTFHMARPLDIHPALLELCHVRYREALEGRVEIPAERTLLLLVGRGTSDPDANANIARISRFLWEAYGVGWSSVAFSGLTRPSVDEGLTICRRLGYERIVVQPYFLFDGILLKRIYETVDRHAEADPSDRFRRRPASADARPFIASVRGSCPRGDPRRAAHELRGLQVPRPPDRPRGRPRRAAGGASSSRPRVARPRRRGRSRPPPPSTPAPRNPAPAGRTVGRSPLGRSPDATPAGFRLIAQGAWKTASPLPSLPAASVARTTRT